MFQQYTQSVGIIYHVYLATDKYDGRSERFERDVIINQADQRNTRVL